MSPSNRSFISHRLAALAVFSALMFFFWRPIEDYDIWFHMVSGREVAVTGHIPDSMFYLLPLLGEPTSFIEWGFGLVYHLAYTLGGYAGMATLNAAFGAGALFLAYCAAIGKREMLHPIALLALALVAWLITVRINYRAETALLLCMAATLYALERYAERGDWRRLIPIPISGWLLIQLHPSVVFLMPLLGAYAIEFFFSPPAGRGRGHVVLTLAVTAASTLALACLNPYGWHQVALPFVALLSGKGMMADITEYIPVMNTEYASNFVTMAAFSVLALIFQRERRISSGLLLALFGTLTFLYVRNIGLFALMLLSPLVRWSLHAFPGKIPPRLQHAGASVVLFALVMLPVWQGNWGSGARPGLFPEKSAAYLKQHLPGGHVLNFYDYGGYLAWALGPGFLVFVDGHDTKANLAVRLHDTIFRAEPGWENAMAPYRIDTIFTPAVMQFSGRMIPLVEQLAVSSEWRLIVREPSGLLFLRADLVAAGELDKRQIWEQMIDEAQRELRNFPDHPDPWAALATAYQKLGDTQKAEQAVQKFRQLNAQASSTPAR